MMNRLFSKTLEWYKIMNDFDKHNKMGAFYQPKRSDKLKNKKKNKIRK